MTIKNELDFGEVLRDLQVDGFIADAGTRREFEGIIKKVLDFLENHDWALGSAQFHQNDEVQDLFYKICDGEEVEIDQVFDDLIGVIEDLFWDLEMGEEQGSFDVSWQEHLNWEF